MAMPRDWSHMRDASRYQATCLVGNWNEDRELKRSVLKDMLSKKATGTLRLDAYQQRMATALQEVELTKTDDDANVHFGDVIQLVHLETGNVLASDVSDKDTRPGEEACAATAAPDVRSPCARNTFIIVKYVPPRDNAVEPDYRDNVLRYGQKIRLAVHPYHTGDVLDSTGGSRPLCLFSKPVSTTHFAKYSRSQLVGFTYRDTFDTVWQVVTPDPAHRLVSEGVEVLAGAPILLVHCATQKPLLVLSQRYPNDFGNEFELTAAASASQGLKLAMEQTTKGLLKGSLPKTERSDNYWTFITGSKIQNLPQPSQHDEQAALAVVRSLAAEMLHKHGSLFPLEKKLVTWENHKFELPADELPLILRHVGSQMPEPEIHMVTKQFAVPQKPGVMDANMLLKQLRAAAESMS